MSADDTKATLTKLLSVPGLVALAFLGIMVLAVSRIVGADTLVREVLTEVVAGFGNAILLLAVFGLFFRSGLERLIRMAPGGNTVADSAEHLKELLGNIDQRGRDVEGSQYDVKLDCIDAAVCSLAYESIPALQSELGELRRLTLDAEQGQGAG